MGGEKACGAGPVVAREGITPAWAGKRVITGNLLFVFRDHPRVGGEKGGLALVHATIVGSPPRRRGKAGLFQIVNVGLGITPAQAGKSLPCET